MSIDLKNGDGRALVALGSNLGDSVSVIQRAMARLQSFSAQPLVASSLWQTSPVNCPPGSPPFVNAAVLLAPRPGETPESLLAKLKEIETEFGRRPKILLNEPRPLDLDLIAFGAETRSTPALTLPHPRAHVRKFVLAPCAEIAPHLVLPGQAASLKQLLDSLDSPEEIRLVMALPPPSRPSTAAG